MNQPNLSIFKNPFSLQIIPFLLTIFFSESLAIYRNSTRCAPQDCGNGLVIEYPFWIPGLQESYCGSREFITSCKDKNPVLKLSGDDYIIKNIFYQNSSVLLADAEVFDQENKCPAPHRNLSLLGTPFSYGPDTTQIYFYYNCSKLFDRERYDIPCETNSSAYSFAVFHENGIENCQPPVNSLIMSDSIDELLGMNYTDVLKMGFVLNWSVVDCDNCKGHGGHCGSDHGDFICFCKDNIGRKSCGGGLKVGQKIGIGVGAAGFTAILLCLVFFLYRRNRKTGQTNPALVSRYSSSNPSSASSIEKSGSYFGVHLFTFNDLEEATKNFDPNNVLGDGGFGTVYKGKLRDGRYVAVKRLYENSYRMVEQFLNEVDMLTHLRHKNLVTLYGCTSRHSRELLLVYEYISNGTVADHLHGPLARPGSLSWITRMSIATETASALAYLHASDVIHRDVKTNNILLDDNFCVKVADFGLSRLFPTHFTHISTAPQGTPGYVDPEYHQCYHLTDRSDVYSFGVVLIELISSRPAVDITRHRHEINLSNMAVNKIQNKALHELVDPELGYESDATVRTAIDAVAELAFHCLQSQRDMRPSMKEVLEVLHSLQSTDCSLKEKEKLKSNQPPGSPDTVIIQMISRSITSCNNR